MFRKVSLLLRALQIAELILGGLALFIRCHVTFSGSPALEGRLIVFVVGKPGEPD